MPYFGGSPLIRHALMHAYSGLSSSDDKAERLRDGAARFVGDYFFTCAVLEFADVLAEHVFGSVFMYVLGGHGHRQDDDECLTVGTTSPNAPPSIRGLDGWVR